MNHSIKQEKTKILVISNIDDFAVDKNGHIALLYGKSNDVAVLSQLASIVEEVFIASPEHFIQAVNDGSKLDVIALSIAHHDQMQQRQEQACLTSVIQTLLGVRLQVDAKYDQIHFSGKNTQIDCNEIALIHRLTDPNHPIHNRIDQGIDLDQTYLQALSAVEESGVMVINSAKEAYRVSDKELPLLMDKDLDIAFETVVGELNDKKLPYALRSTLFDHPDFLNANFGQLQQEEGLATLLDNIKKAMDDFLASPLAQKEVFFKIDDFGGNGGAILGNVSDLSPQEVKAKIAKLFSRAHHAIDQSSSMHKVFFQEMAARPDLGDIRWYLRNGKSMIAFIRQGKKEAQVANLFAGGHVQPVPSLEAWDNVALRTELEKILPHDRYQQIVAIMHTQKKVLNALASADNNPMHQKLRQPGSFVGFDMLTTSNANGEFQIKFGEGNVNNSTMAAGQLIVQEVIFALLDNDDFACDLEALYEKHGVFLSHSLLDMHFPISRLYLFIQAKKPQIDYPIMEEMRALLMQYLYDVSKGHDRGVNQLKQILLSEYNQALECIH